MSNPMKIPPQSGKDEQALLGALLDDNRHYNLIAMLSADDFADPVHALIYEAIARNLDAGRPAYRSTLERELSGQLDEVGGVSYLEQLNGQRMRRCSQRAHNPEAGGVAGDVKESLSAL
jgi:replicative DNA helicase